MPSAYSRYLKKDFIVHCSSARSPDKAVGRTLPITRINVALIVIITFSGIPRLSRALKIHSDLTLWRASSKSMKNRCNKNQNSDEAEEGAEIHKPSTVVITVAKTVLFLRISNQDVVRTDHTDNPKQYHLQQALFQLHVIARHRQREVARRQPQKA